MSSDLRLAAEATPRLIVSPRARVMRLRVDPRTGEVVLTVPKRMSRRQALDWAAGHGEWIAAQRARIVPATALVPGAAFPLHGIAHVIDWAEGHKRVPAIVDGRLVVGGPLANLDARILRWARRHAATLLAEETREFAAKVGVEISRVAVGDPVSRWGSCSSSGAIRYSWRLILAPDWVRRATVAHEVAHRVHMNHKPVFHALVAELLGADPKPARLWLRRNGPSLHRVGIA